MDRDWDKLRRWLIRERLEGQSVTTICKEAQVDRKMFYRWWSRYQAEGWKGLEEKRRGRPGGSELEFSLKEKVIKLRQRYCWGPSKIAGHLNHKGFTIDHNRVYRVICEAGLNHPISEPRKTWGTKRFQREHNNSLWQSDFKLCSDDNWMISYQDDHSRFITGSVKIWSPTGENALRLLEKAVKRMVFQNRYLLIRERSLSLREAEPQSLRGTVASWELSISLPACAGLQPQER